MFGVVCFKGKAKSVGEETSEALNVREALKRLLDTAGFRKLKL